MRAHGNLILERGFRASLLLVGVAYPVWLTVEEIGLTELLLGDTGAVTEVVEVKMPDPLLSSRKVVALRRGLVAKLRCCATSMRPL